MDTERRLQALKQDWMVDRVESCRKIQEDQHSSVTTVDSLQYV